MATNFEELVKQVQETNIPMKITPKEILNQLGVRRRGWRVVEAAGQLFEKYEVICEPEFGKAWAYGEVEIKPKPKVHSKSSKAAGIEEFDPTPRISMLRAANLTQVKENNEGPGLISVTRETKLSTAIHLMMNHRFSQLPILSGRAVEGMVSWRSRRCIDIRR